MDCPVFSSSASISVRRVIDDATIDRRRFSSGIAAFFLKKFGNKKGKNASNYVRPESGVKRPLSAANMTITDDVDESQIGRKAPARSRSAKSGSIFDDRSIINETMHRFF